MPLHHHGQLHPLATHGFTDRFAPFLACRKVASRKASFQSIRPRRSSSRSNCRQAVSHIPCSCQPRKRRQQVTPLGYALGISRQRAPARSNQIMPSQHARFLIQGRPRPSFRPTGSGKKCSIRCHCRSVRLMPAVNIHAGFQRKYLA
jgi:hypothetical protein